MTTALIFAALFLLLSDGCTPASRGRCSQYRGRRSRKRELSLQAILQLKRGVNAASVDQFSTWNVVQWD